jgi:hypothetical protein
MRTTAVERAKRFPLGWIAAAILGCALAGVGMAAISRPTSLLAGAQSGPPPLDSVWAQLYHAKMVDTEDAWRAVITNFPKESIYYHNLAKQGLVYYYIRTQEFNKAIKPLEDLAGQEDSSAFGLAGLVVVYSKLHDDRKAGDANQRLTSDMRTALKKQAPQMAELLDKADDRLASREGQ